MPTREKLRQLAAASLAANLGSVPENLVLSAADKAESERLKGMRLEEVRQEYQRVLNLKPGKKITKENLIKHII